MACRFVRVSCSSIFSLCSAVRASRSSMRAISSSCITFIFSSISVRSLISVSSKLSWHTSSQSRSEMDDMYSTFTAELQTRPVIPLEIIRCLKWSKLRSNMRNDVMLDDEVSQRLHPVQGQY